MIGRRFSNRLAVENLRFSIYKYRMISVGEKVDLSITLKVVRNVAVQELTLGDLLDRKSVVSVYMRNNTSACDVQNKSLVPVYEELINRGINLIALSKDTCGSHKRYAEKLGIAHIGQ